VQVEYSEFEIFVVSVGAAALSDIAPVLGAVGGGLVTALFKTEALFGAYAIGLAIGFFAYFLISLLVYGKERAGRFMGD